MAMLGAPVFRITKSMVPASAENTSTQVRNFSDKNGREYAEASPRAVKSVGSLVIWPSSVQPALSQSCTECHFGPNVTSMTREAAAPAEGLRERHRKRTAADLEEAALELFCAKGFDAVTIDDIAAAADVSRRTFFRYYASKEDVVLSDHPKRLDELQAALDRRPADEPALTALRQAILSLAGSVEEQREHMLRRFRLVTDTPALEARSLCLQRNWETSVTAMLAERMGVDPADDLRPGTVAATTMAAMRVATANWLALGGDGDLTAIVASALDLLDGGLQAAADPQPRRRPASTRPGSSPRARSR
jgi:AcrR family transcriptional regulator